MNYPIIIKDLSFPEELIEQVLCEPDKKPIIGGPVHKWVKKHILPKVRKELDDPRLMIAASHVHVGSDGLMAHDHLPHLYTSVLYLFSARGSIVLHKADGYEEIYPEEGMLLVFPGDLVHHVNKSPYGEMRISLVTNYEYRTVQDLSEAVQ